MNKSNAVGDNDNNAPTGGALVSGNRIAGTESLGTNDSSFEPEIKRPSKYREVPGEGIYLRAQPTNGQSEGPPIWICSYLRVLADTRSPDKESWGRLISFDDKDGTEHRTVIDCGLLHDPGTVPQLASLGLRVAGRARHEDILEYIRNHHTEKRALSVDKVGWAEAAYVYFHKNFGKSEEEVVFKGRVDSPPVSRGTLEEWREHIALSCAGNSRLVLALSTAFAGPLLAPLGFESGGFHFRGTSSVGKSTALDVATSVWGIEKGNWNTTANGLEAIAALHNDGLLCLDELAQVTPEAAGKIAYMLANGKGKARMEKTLIARKPLKWSLMFLSSGEISLSSHMATEGIKAHGGQEVRLVDIEADAGKGHGLFEYIGSAASGDAFSKHLVNASKKYTGTAILSFLENLTALPISSLPSKLRAKWSSLLASILEGKEHTNGEISRVAGRFALVALAGELATEWQITGWKAGEAVAAAKSCFESWARSRGNGSSDGQKSVAQVRNFLQSQGGSRFISDSDSNRYIRDCAGFICESEGVREFCIYSEVFRRELCKGYEPKMVARELKSRGLLVTEGAFDTARRQDPTNRKRRLRCYVIKEGILEDDPMF